MDRHKVIDAATKVRMGEAKHQFMMLRQEEKNIEMLRFVEGEIYIMVSALHIFRNAMRLKMSDSAKG